MCVYTHTCELKVTMETIVEAAVGTSPLRTCPERRIRYRRSVQDCDVRLLDVTIFMSRARRVHVTKLCYACVHPPKKQTHLHSPPFIKWTRTSARPKTARSSVRLGDLMQVSCLTKDITLTACQISQKLSLHCVLSAGVGFSSLAEGETVFTFLYQKVRGSPPW